MMDGSSTGSSSLLLAAEWVEAILLGTVATVVATLAVAAMGFLMLTGRVEPRRGLTVLLGCFLLFGAPVIAAGLRQALGDGDWTGVADAGPTPPPAAPPPPPKPAQDYDPYGGVAVPTTS